MASNIDACIFLPGHIANGDEEINIPLLGMEQIERLMDLYRDRHYAPFFPYIAEAITLIRSKHQCERTPLVNRWIEILTIGEHKYIDHILCILLLKYGWDIPQNILNVAFSMPSLLCLSVVTVILHIIEQIDLLLKGQ